ncbi:MAG: metallophosphoesterase [Bacteriovoracaceae bacterium]|nr:metallophosphoesterase [Bacteriovoracaceae bacterium]
MTSFVSISDIHIREVGDSGYQCLEDFFNHPKTKAATHIGLLGDIFDLVAGNHSEYLVKWSKVFDLIRFQCQMGKVVYFAEGNHDMHLSRLIKNVTSSWPLNEAHLFQVIVDDMVLEMNGLHILIGHGDELNQEDTSYLKYKKFIKKPVMNFIADFVMPFSVLDYVGKKASQHSRSYGERLYNEEEVKEKFRKGVVNIKKDKLNYIVGGHSHVVDNWTHKEIQYLNNGYPPKSRKFVSIDSSGGTLESFY